MTWMNELLCDGKFRISLEKFRDSRALCWWNVFSGGKCFTSNQDYTHTATDTLVRSEREQLCISRNYEKFLADFPFRWRWLVLAPHILFIRFNLIEFLSANRSRCRCICMSVVCVCVCAAINIALVFLIHYLLHVLVRLRSTPFRNTFRLLIRARRTAKLSRWRWHETSMWNIIMTCFSLIKRKPNIEQIPLSPLVWIEQGSAKPPITQQIDKKKIQFQRGNSLEV